MKMLNDLGTRTFNGLLRRWRAEGMVIGWSELRKAADLAWQAQEAQEVVRERRHQHRALEEVRERLALEVVEAEEAERRALEALEERQAEQREAEEAERAMRNQEGERTCG